MNDDKIAEIKAQHAIDERWRNGPSMLSPQSHDHRGYLLAEVERLRAALPYDWDMLQASRASLREHMAEIKQVTRERDEARAEVERLRARVEMLEAVLHAIFPEGANIMKWSEMR